MKRSASHPCFNDISESPIRGEIFSVERLEDYAIYLANHLQAGEGKRAPRRHLLRRMKESGQLLLESYQTIVSAVKNNESITPAAEWLLDNFHIVEEQLREIQEDLPASYYAELPKVELGDLAGYPRIYALALALVAHSDSRLESEKIRRYIEAFQSHSYLNLGEIWALPIALRMVLVENLRRVTIRIMWDRDQRRLADSLAQEILDRAHHPDKLRKSISKISQCCGLNPSAEYAFISQMATALRNQEEDVWDAMEHLESLMKNCNLSVEEVVSLEHQFQAINQVTIANIISSMRLLSNIDWMTFFQSVSLLDRELAKDPSGHYSKMDFQTQDEYRHAIERIAKGTDADERTIAAKALELAGRGGLHVGFFLKENGVEELEKVFQYRLKSSEFFFRLILKRNTLFYLFSLIFLTGLLLFASLGYAYQFDIPFWNFIMVVILVAIPCSDLAVSLFNFFLSHLLKPRRLAKMDVSEGIPSDARTLVIIPCMLCDSETIHELLKKIEVHYLGNSDPEVYFALVTDFTDADEETLAQDKIYLEQARNGVRNLNNSYARDQVDRFFLFHRRRLWNASEGKWMGYERKRGKIEELNHLLRGAENTSFQVVDAPKDLLTTFKYVVTMDADTHMGLDTVKKLVGTAIHPLNHPVIDPQKRRVIKGYGIVQPRINISLESSSRSTFASIFSGHTGIDPYTTAVSDVYQDLFGEGSFTGKGLYDIDVFETVMANRVPENTVLSHDLFEGLFARTALATDIELLDDYPSNYQNYIQRQHRWVRGDWQIAQWVLPFVPNAEGSFVVNTLPLISRWKIQDNLRRSLVAASLFLLYLGGWFFLPGHPAYWTILATLIIALPCFIHVANGLLTNSGKLPWVSTLWNEIGTARITLWQFFLTLVFLPHKAFVEVDAALRAIYRTRVSKRRCLEWVPSAQVDMGNGRSKKTFWQKNWPVELALFFILVAVFVKSNQLVLFYAMPFILFWSLFPKVNDWTGRKLQKRTAELNDEGREFFLEMGRRIWSFFETFVTVEDNWLPPDNIQEDPEQIIAHRTSPTNIGLYALSILAAKDLGFIGVIQSKERLRKVLGSIKKLEKYRGHLLNWYDTKTLAPLYPKYVSVVDSGNLAGYLITVKQGILETGKEPLLKTKLLNGLRITLKLLEDEVYQLERQKRATTTFNSIHIHKHIRETQRILNGPPPERLRDWALIVRFLRQNAADIEDSLSALEIEHGIKYYVRLRRWANTLLLGIKEIDDILRTYTPWVFELDWITRDENRNARPEVQRIFEQILSQLDMNHPLEEWPIVLEKVLGLFAEVKVRESGEESPRVEKIFNFCQKSIESLKALELSLEGMRADCESLFFQMDFSFLLDREREVFAIGYNVSDSRVDNAYYDLLASEARLASFVAILKGDVKSRHWFRLGRHLVPVNGKRALISWSASMFEYLMPQLVMKNFENTLLDETVDVVVRRQISYGKKLKIPWGVSEAGYNARDINFNYQYGPFGIPGLGLKRGLGHDLVISPYSSFLAALVNPTAAVKNLNQFINDKVLSCFGFYEAVDYTPERLSPGQKYSIIHSYMAHHQGMSLVAVDNVLNENCMQDRFHSEPRVRAAQLLLQEKVPQKIALSEPKAAQIEWAGAGDSLLRSFSRIYRDAVHSTPRVQILSNGSYSLALSTAGSGYAKYDGLAVTRWREDVTRDNWGSYIFVRDVNRAKAWSCTYQPRLREPEEYKASFAEDRVEFQRRDDEILTHTQVIVAPEDNVELRQVALTNESSVDRVLEVTSYLEPILTNQNDDLAHPAFSNLFLQTEYLDSRQCLLVKRRPRSSQKKEVWGLHGVVSDTEYEGDVQFETDRARFLGRGRNLANPQAMEEGHELSGTVGSTLDPVLSLRVRVRVPPGGTVHVLFTTGLAMSREEILQMADRYHDIRIFERESILAWTKSRIDLRHLGLDAEAAYLFQRLAERIIYSDSSLRRSSRSLAQEIRPQASLWPYGIGGDLPIVVLMVDDERDMGMLRRLLRGHEYLRMKGLAYDFVILNESRSIYLQDLQEEILKQVRFSGCQSLLNKTGGIFPFRLDLMPEKDRNLIQALARVVFAGSAGTLKEQLARKVLAAKPTAIFKPGVETSVIRGPDISVPELKFFNGVGGFSQDGKEYIIVLNEGQCTPAPWINVIANAHDFGFQVSESGAGFTWSLNSRENRLTGWSNDSVIDPAGEAFYLRDEETGEVWTPTPLPCRDSQPYLIRHGQGYSVFEHGCFGIESKLTMFVPEDEPLKISSLKLTNYSKRTRKISVWAYVEWVLGNLREKSLPYISTEVEEGNILIAKNSYNHEFAERVSFFAKSGHVQSFTCDRKEFLGRNGDMEVPLALKRESLSGRVGTGLDPCAVLHDIVEIKIGESCDLHFLLGQAESKAIVHSLVKKFSDKKSVDTAFHNVQVMWEEILGRVQIKTPDEALDIMMNRWLLYQTLVCRFWSRSAFYQSGGAFGFRDQLQDCMAFAHVAPDQARMHILRAASRQFPEGDVQHWWHPPTGRGVRTHFSDDLLWMPLVVSHYIKVTGDAEILREQVHFIEAPLLTPEQEDSYTTPEVSKDKSSLLDHCLRAIDCSLKFGSHGLPLIGSGDWNDGMNRVGEKGKGESVWMAWFLYKVIDDFISYCDNERKQKYLLVMENLKKNVEENGWDGRWYRRAYFDDGTPIGSESSQECRIDSLAQSWSVLSGAGDPKRQKIAMQSVLDHLVLQDKGIVLLLNPPFDKTPLDPGYIKGYVPGVRENGGQYTHAALWVLMAFASLGDREVVQNLFEMLNPIKHGKNRLGMQRYKIEPYVVAADIYTVEPNVGRGGWSWYTGSASWFYRAGLESVLGLRIENDKIYFDPCAPVSWDSYQVRYQYKGSTYNIKIELSGFQEKKSNMMISVDGNIPLSEGVLQLVDDHKEHQVLVRYAQEGFLGNESSVLL